MNKKLLSFIEQIFTQKLQAKTGWGRNEILSIYKESVNEALITIIDLEEGLKKLEKSGLDKEIEIKL
jgi:hypothetical protein